MALRVFIYGMGRIGRLLFRKLFDAGIEIVGINDLYMTESKLAYLLNHDTTYGDWMMDGTLSYISANDDDGFIDVFGRNIRFYKQPDPSQLPLGELGVDMVLECTGLFSSNPDTVHTAFLNAGAGDCLFCYPLPLRFPHYVYNVNAFYDQILDCHSSPTSAGSASMNTAALVLKAISDGPGITAAFIEEVRSYTGNQNLCDNVTGDNAFERGRAAAQNIVPTTNKELGSVAVPLPQLNGSVLSNALRTPTLVGGAINITIVLSTTSTRDEINAIMKSAANESLRYADGEPLVSSDAVSNDSTSIFLDNQTVVIENICNLTVLYDNEMGFVNQIVKLLTSCRFN